MTREHISYEDSKTQFAGDDTITKERIRFENTEVFIVHGKLWTHDPEAEYESGSKWKIIPTFSGNDLKLKEYNGDREFSFDRFMFQVLYTEGILVTYKEKAGQPYMEEMTIHQMNKLIEIFNYHFSEPFIKKGLVKAEIANPERYAPDDPHLVITIGQRDISIDKNMVVTDSGTDVTKNLDMI